MRRSKVRIRHVSMPGLLLPSTAGAFRLALTLVLWLGMVFAVTAQVAFEEPSPAAPTLERSESVPSDGERFSMTVEQLALAEILELLAEEWALTLQVDSLPEVLVSVTMSDLTLDDALGQLLHPRQLDFRLIGGVLRVGAPDVLLEEDDSRRRRHESMMPLETAYMQVNYASAEALGELVSSADEAGLLSSRGSLQVDVRTNTL